MDYEPPPGVKENDLSLEKLLITAYLDRWGTGEFHEDIWTTVFEVAHEMAEDKDVAFKHLMQFAELTAGLLAATYPEPLEVLSGLRTFSGPVQPND